MSAFEHCPDLLMQLALPQHELLEIHRSKISLHLAKTGYDYPAIRLPFTFSKLAGLSTRVFQTVHDGALAFLVVVSSACTPSESKLANHENASVSADPRIYPAKVVCSNHTEPIVLFTIRYIRALN